MSPQRGRWGVLAVALALACAAGGFLWSKREGAPLGYETVGARVSQAGYIRGSGPNGARLSFSDGTRVDVSDGTHLRVTAVDSRGARLAIEGGHAALSVVRRPAGAWIVDAGPFVIRVTGTEFDVDWSTDDESLNVSLYQGSLTVSGPPAPLGVMLRPGQRLSARQGRLSIEPLVQRHVR